MKVKICGITNEPDLLCSVEAGADMIGFVFAPSKRRIEERKAVELARLIPYNIEKTGVFVNEAPQRVRNIMESCSLDALQFHGEETPEYCSLFGAKAIKSIRIRCRSDIQIMKKYNCRRFVLDTYHPFFRGGSGCLFDHDIAVEAKAYGKIIVAGGLNISNISRVVHRINPWGVDVSSGVEEKPGKKDHRLIREFIIKAKELT